MSGVARSSRVLRSAKGRARAAGEKALIMGPLKDWGKKSVIISGGPQYTLEDMITAGWEKLGRLREVKNALHQAAEVGKKIFEEDKTALHLKWLETEGGEVMRVGEEELKRNEAIYAQAFAQGVAVQELTKVAEVVIREETDKEIRDIVYVNGAPTGASFMTPRKNKGKERAKEVSLSPAPKGKKSQSGLSIEELMEELEDSWGPDRRGESEIPAKISRWTPVLGEEEEEYYILDSEGRRKGPFRYSRRRDWSSSDPELLQKADEREGTLSAEEEERYKKLEDETWDAGLYTKEDTDQDGKYDDPSLDATDRKSTRLNSSHVE